MSQLRKLQMKISLNALEHLGMNLYSNVPAVLSEVVANAWDADAAKVKIQLDKSAERIVIDDDGTGMTRDEVIERFLTVGFRRRTTLGDQTEKGRRPMGRKGIGKLSTFSIARVVEVYTERGGERTSFQMDREAIREKIENADNELYEPVELQDWPADHPGGTRIVLSDLAKSLTKLTDAGLRRRVARRFSIIGPRHGFVVSVNGKDITAADRGYHGALEYLWIYGKQNEVVTLANNLKRTADDRTANVAERLKSSSLSLKGWIGTVESPGQLKDEEGDNLNRIAIFMRGKLAQEDMLDDFGQKEIYADYLIGELHCDELDLAAEADIATSSRQSLKQDDPRYETLRSTVLSELRYIASQWSERRREDGTKFARTVPAVAEWLDSLEGDTKKQAQKWVGRLNEIRSDKDNDRKELLKASILAFESYRQRQQLSMLDKMSVDSVAAVLPIFKDIDSLELSYYGQIVNLRLGVVRKLQEMMRTDVKEKIIQQHVFDHLWLIDPSWERAKGTENLETKIGEFLKGDTAKLNSAEKKGRIDIAYRTASGSHVIIELKRASVATSVDKLAAQVRKYRNGVRKIIEESDYAGWPIQIVCLVGNPPPEWNERNGQQEVKETLATVDARLVFYDQLVDNAQRSYADYLEAHKKTDRLWDVFKSIDDFVPTQQS
ncbi:heat-shock protein [Aurantimonas endophytica]|nr:ATP-binding protein [Aurantimonas endophytica]MCO6406372.1 heat-shock protein [Aurantimonas endophytica]